MLVFDERGNRSTWSETSLSREEKQQNSTLIRRRVRNQTQARAIHASNRNSTLECLITAILCNNTLIFSTDLIMCFRLLFSFDRETRSSAMFHAFWSFASCGRSLETANWRQERIWGSLSRASPRYHCLQVRHLPLWTMKLVNPR